MAFALRVVGIGWGLPGPDQVFSYHPDEFRSVEAVRGMIERGDLDPRFYSYGSLGLYVELFFAWPLRALGIVSSDRGLHLALRLVAALGGTLTVWLVWRLGRRWLGERGALLAAAIQAVLPGETLHAHFVGSDVMAGSFAALALLLALRLQEAPSVQRALAAGFAAGLAAAVKYPVGLVGCAALAALLQRGTTWRHVAALAAAPLGFVAAMPYAILDWPAFRTGIGHELAHARRGHGDLFAATGNGWWHHLTANLPYVLGPGLVVLAIAGVVLLAKERRPQHRVLLGFLLPFALLVGASQVRFLRYLLPLCPVLALAAAQAGEALFRRGRLGRLAVGVALAWSFGLSAAQSVAMAGGDPRDRAMAWIRGHVRPAERLGVLHLPNSFWYPPLTRWNGGDDQVTRPRFLDDQKAGRVAWTLVPCGPEGLGLTATRPDWVYLSELEWREEERLGKPGFAAWRRELEASHALAASFDSIPIDWRWVFGRRFAPHDWLYPFAQARVYGRRR